MASADFLRKGAPAELGVLRIGQLMASRFAREALAWASALSGVNSTQPSGLGHSVYFQSIQWLCFLTLLRACPFWGNMFPHFEKSIAVVMAYVVFASAFIVGAELLVVILL